MTATALPSSYYRVVGASALSNLADGIRLAAFPLLAASVTDSATMIALVFAAGQAPWVVFGLWAGALADRTDRRALIQRVAGARTALLLMLAGLVFAGLTPLWLLVVASFVLGLAEVLADTTTGTLVPLLVPAEHFERANSRVVAAEITGNELVGPAIGGLLFAIGASLPFFTNASLLAAALLLLAGLPALDRNHTMSPQDADHQPHIVETRRTQAGLDFIRTQPLLRTITWSSAVLGAVDAAWFALLVLFVKNQLGYGATGFGLLLAIGALGGLAGAALADRRGGVEEPGLSLPALVGLIYASMGVSLVVLAVAPSPATTTAALVVTSGGFALWNVVVVSARQRATPAELLGRVGGSYRTIVITASLVGALVGGALADVASLTTALSVYGVALGCLAPFVFRAFRATTPS